ALLLWDEDFAPLFPDHGLHLGTENMPIQQREYRSQFALLLAREPWMSARAADVPREARERLHAVVDATGAHMSAVHYVGASMGPMVSTLQQLQQRGLDLFARDERLRRFATFYLNLLTPPEVRFGGRRKLISVGQLDRVVRAPGPAGHRLRRVEPAAERPADRGVARIRLSPLRVPRHDAAQDRSRAAGARSRPVKRHLPRMVFGAAERVGERGR